MKEREEYQDCTTTNGRRTCSTKYRTKSYSEGTTISGIGVTELEEFYGQKICTKHGKDNYYDISKDRQSFIKTSDAVRCPTGENVCGGANIGSMDTDYSYCYKTYDGQRCPVQFVQLIPDSRGRFFSGTAYSENGGLEPIYTMTYALEQKCIDGTRYTPSRTLDQIFSKPNTCRTKKNKAWNQLLEEGQFQQYSQAKEQEYTFLANNGMVARVNDKYRSYLNINWSYHQREDIHLWSSHYPHWDYDNCDKKGYSAADFKKFAESMGTIDSMSTGVSICQYILLGLSTIFLCCTACFTKCGKVKEIPDGLHYGLLTKLVCTILLNIVCLVLTVVLMVTAMGIKKDDVNFYKDKICVASYVSYQVEKFEPFYSSVVTNVIVIFVACFLQNVYEALIYPSIRFGWIGGFVELNNAGRTPYKPRQTVTVTQTHTATTAVTPAPMMVA